MKTVKKASALFFMCAVTSFAISKISPVKVANIDFLKKEITNNNDTLYVVNFWSTWCDPCVKELPFFKSAYQKFASQKVKMIYVCLNAPADTAKVNTFVVTNNLFPEVILLSDNNPNVWINKIDSAWSGTIPATTLYKNGKYIYFHEGPFTQEKLNKLIQSNLN